MTKQVRIFLTAVFALGPACAGAAPSVPKSEHEQLTEICKSKSKDVTGQLASLCRSVLAAAAPKPRAPSTPKLAVSVAGEPGTPQAPPAPLPAVGCVQNRWFVRSDQLDNFNYMVTLAADQASSASAKGVSINYTDDIEASKQTAAIDGRISYLAYCQNNTATFDQTFVKQFAFAPFVGGNGSWNEPVTTTSTSSATSKIAGTGTQTTESSNGITTTNTIKNKNGTITTITKKYSLSALRVGADFQTNVSLSFVPPNQQPPPFLPSDIYFYASPYYQTDFRGFAQIVGADLRAEPVFQALFVNSGVYTPAFGYVTQFSAGAELTQVNDPGLTLLSKGAHEWIGETVRPNLTLFPGGVAIGSAEPDWFENWVRGRISLIGTQEFYWDAATKTTAAYYQAMVQYKLGSCKIDLKQPNETCKTAGSSAISLEYDFGREINTNVKVNQMLVKLSYAY